LEAVIYTTQKMTRRMMWMGLLTAGAVIVGLGGYGLTLNLIRTNHYCFDQSTEGAAIGAPIGNEGKRRSG
jgi:hypothetical protein